MSKQYVVPGTRATTELLAMIFGNEISVAKGEATEISDSHVATFIDDDDKLVAICACDKQFVAYSGAALSMIPANVANEMIGSNDIPESILSNFYEVMNICSKLMMDDDSLHLRLDKIAAPGEASAEIGSMADCDQTLSFTLNIPQYGQGGFDFLIYQSGRPA